MRPAQHSDFHVVANEAELEELIGSPGEQVKMKLLSEIDDAAKEFIERAPFVVVATCDADGRLDASPKGDPPGFVHVINPKTLVIPERKGNSLGFGPRNILATGRIGLIFIVPGQRETYRVNGTAFLTRDPELLNQLAVAEKPALMATIVNVEEAFFHCGKAVIRSKLWEISDKSELDRRPIAEQLGAMMGGEDLVEVVANALERDYKENLY